MTNAQTLSTSESTDISEISQKIPDDVDPKNGNARSDTSQVTNKVTKPKSKRNRMPLSCTVCRKRKIKVCYKIRTKK
jgi:heme activator protein 1